MEKKMVWHGRVEGKKGGLEIRVFRIREPKHELSEKHRAIQLIAETADGKQLGRVHYGYNPINTYMKYLGVKEEQREKGAGRKLVELALQEIDEATMRNPPIEKEMHANTPKGNTAAEKILTDNDFKFTDFGWKRRVRE